MNFIAKALLKRQLKGIPEDQVDMLLSVIEKNPAFFKQIADEVQAKISTGMSQQDAAMTVMKSHETELREIMKDVNK